MTEETLEVFKGFDKDLKCRGFQYEVGKTYTHNGPVSLCSSGFHAVELPLDAMSYYPPIGSVYHRAALGGVTDEREKDSKRVGAQITVGAQINVFGLIEAHVEAIWDRAAKKPSEKKNATTGDSAHAATTGYSAHAATTGYSAHAATTGYSAHAATTGDYANAATTGRYANAATTGYSATNEASTADEGSIAAVLGRGKAKGALGCWLVLTERDNKRNILGVQAVQVDGETVHPNVFYTLLDGKVTEA